MAPPLINVDVARANEFAFGWQWMDPFTARNLGWLLLNSIHYCSVMTMTMRRWRRRPPTPTTAGWLLKSAMKLEQWDHRRLWKYGDVVDVTSEMVFWIWWRVVWKWCGEVFGAVQWSLSFSWNFVSLSFFRNVLVGSMFEVDLIEMIQLCDRMDYEFSLFGCIEIETKENFRSMLKIFL